MATRGAFLAILLLASAPAGAQTLKPWRHGVVEAKSDSGFVFMAQQHGFAEQQGLKLELPQFTGDALEIKALLAGELDSYEGSPGAPIIASARGAAIKLVGCYWPGLTYGLYSKPDTKGGADLKGKSFATSAPGALPELLARAVLQKFGISGDEVRFVAMGSDTDRYKALVAGVVDIAAASTEFAPIAASQGVKLLYHAHDVAPEYLRFCLYMTPDTIAKRRPEAVRFLAAQMAAQRFALDHPAETEAVARAMAKLPADDQRPAYVFEEVKKYAAIDPELNIPVDRLVWMQDLLVRTGNLNAPGDIKKLVEPSLREEAAKLVKP
jgi:NitT/TauT family transport system substrate-binding protein